MKSKSEFDVTITDAFEIGKIEGMREAFKELSELAIVDPQFNTYIKARLKSFEEKVELVNKYRLFQRGPSEELN